MLDVAEPRVPAGHGPGAPWRLPPHPEGTGDGAGAPEWRAYLRTLARARGLIAIVTALCLLASLLYALAAPPVYEAQMLIHVEEDSPNASKNMLNDMASLFETKKAAIAEMELLRSRLVAAQAVDAVRFDIQAAPRRFPLAGFLAAGAGARALSAPGLFGDGGYGWGAEAIAVSRFDVPAASLGQAFDVEALGAGRYRLRDGGGTPLLTGAVGTVAAAATPQGPLRLRIDRLDGLPGARYTLRRLSRQRAVQQLQQALAIAEQGKQSGVIEVRLRDADAGRASGALGALGAAYLRQNLARKREAADRTLAALDAQLTPLKARLEQAEAAYNGFRARHDTVDLAEEVRLGLQRAAELKTVRQQLEQKRIELSARFTAFHPLLLAVEGQRREVAREAAALDAQIKAWPQLEQEQARLARDVKVATDLYLALLNTAQQLRVLSVGAVDNVRLVDAPVEPERPAGPQRLLALALAGGSGLFLGCLLALARKALRGGIDDAGQIEAALGPYAVYASIPHSRAQDRLRRGRPWLKQGRGQAGRQELLAQAAPDDAAVETLRAFRSALEFALPHSRNNIVALAGTTRGVGTAFISLNLALLLAGSGRNTLLVDADLRAGRPHAGLDLGAGPGLADALCGALDARQVLRRAVRDRLDVIPAGAPPAAADFLRHLNLGSLLDTLRPGYDVVLVMTPPVLAAADALTIASHAGAVFLVARADRTTQAELGEAIRRLNHAGIAPHGVVFNDAPAGSGGVPAPASLNRGGLVRV